MAVILPVESSTARELVDFLSSLLPHKPLSDLYNVVGRPRHGKTVFYRTGKGTVGNVRLEGKRIRAHGDARPPAPAVPNCAATSRAPDGAAARP